ncbi:MAG: ATP-binding protein [Alphaproteobacteria bacterium]
MDKVSEADLGTEELVKKITKLEKRLTREKIARKKAEELLEEKSQELYGHIQEVSKTANLMEAAIVNAKDGVMIMTADLDIGPEIIYVNEAFSRISGYAAEEVIGKTPRILEDTGTDHATLGRLHKALKNGKSFQGEIQNHTKDGIAYWLDVSIAPVRDEQNKVTHFAAIKRDVTQRKAFEKEMQINREAAEVANRSKDGFLANMSHELRTPMNGIIGLSELLTEMSLPEEQGELVEAINGSSRNLLILLNDILDLSKIEANELTLEEIPFTFRRVMSQTIELLGNTAGQKNIDLKLSVNPLVPERIIGDPARIQQILNNLVANSIKFTDEGYVRIDVSCQRDQVGDPVLHIRVEDTGIGIPEDKQMSVFQKFTQADVSTSRKYGGTGLGLAITKDLVGMMGGVISMDSAVGKGTTFYVEIPVEEASVDQRPIENAEGTAGEQGVRYSLDEPILIVDDHPVNLLFMSKVLGKLGFTNVDEASGGKLAVELYRQKRHKVIFMDCQMPEIDGFEASAQIRDEEGYINEARIIAVTADAMKGARERCIDSGMNDYISKPVDLEKLKTILDMWMPIPEATHNLVEEAEVCEAPVVEHNDNDGGAVIMDWDRLDLFTNGDLEEEKMLIDLFMSCAQETLGVLVQECQDGCNEAWSSAAHKLKGSAANLGAEVLASICFEAEEGGEESDMNKAKLLSRIHDAYVAVCTTFEERHKSAK